MFLTLPLHPFGRIVLPHEERLDDVLEIRPQFVGLAVDLNGLALDSVETWSGHFRQLCVQLGDEVTCVAVDPLEVITKEVSLAGELYGIG